tara:strand:+ start:992 stop:1192 length:201 start_codon:yes stop_codon:yes gene_type:complete
MERKMKMGMIVRMMTMMICRVREVKEKKTKIENRTERGGREAHAAEVRSRRMGISREKLKIVDRWR